MKLADGVLEELWFGESDSDANAAAEAKASASMAAAVARSVGLKPFPVVAQQVMAITNRASFEPKELAKIISLDPALSTSFLRIANSALYRRIRACNTVQEAVLRLGANTVRDIAIGITTLGLFADTSGYGRIVRNHSVVTAAIARVLADEWRLRTAEDAMLAGLLHDIGRLLLIQTGEALYDQAPEEARNTPDTLHLREREALGYDHAVLGAHVLVEWKIHDPIPRVVAWHHQPGRAYAVGGSVGLLVALLRLADRIEYEIRVHGTLSPAFCDEAAKSGESSYVGFSGKDLVGVTEALVHAREESGALLV